MSRYVVLVLALQATLPIAQAGYPTALELLNDYTATRDKFSSFTGKSLNDVEYRTTPNTNDPRFRFLRNHMKNTLRQDFRFDGKRANTRSHMWGQVMQGMPAVSEKDPSYTSSLRTKDADRWYGRANATKDLGRVTLNMKSRAPTQMSLSRGYKGHEALGYLFGDDERVDVVLRRATSISVRDRMEKAGRSQCYVIDAMAKEGKYTLWIDPEHGYNIAKAEVVRRGGDVAVDGKVVPKGDRYYTLLSNVQFKEIDGVWVPVEADIDYRWNLTNKYDYWEKVHHKVTEFVVDPNHDALGSFASDDILNGAEVRIVGIDSVTYKWQDGELTPNVDKAVIDEIDKMADELPASVLEDKRAVAPAAPTVSDLIERYAETQDKLRSSFISKLECYVRFEAYAKARPNIEPGKIYNQRWKIELRSDGERNYYWSKRWGDMPGFPRFSEENASENHKLWDGKNEYQYAYSPESPYKNGHARLRRKRPPRPNISWQSGQGHAMRGYFPDVGERIDSELAKAGTISLEPRTENINGSECYIINAKGDGSEYRIWIDPKHGYNIARATVKRAWASWNRPKPGSKIPEGCAEVRLSNVRFKDIDGVWLPVQADYRRDHKYVTGEYEKSYNRWKITEFQMNPDHDALRSFEPDFIRNSAKVCILDNGGATYTWQNGELISNAERKN